VTTDASSAYSGVAAAWAAGPARLYDALAAAVVEACPVPLAGLRVLDAGAGTGAVSRVLRMRGAVPVGVDTAEDMVARMRAGGFDACVGDIRALPFADGSFDAAIAAFSITHVDRPADALRELRRVVRGGGVVMASAFAAQPANVSKEATDAVAERFGYVRPSWYERLKTELEPMTSSEGLLRGCGVDAGFVDASVTRITVDSGISEPADIVASRAGIAHLAPFVSRLEPATRDRFFAEAVAAVARNPVALRPDVLILIGRVPSAG